MEFIVNIANCWKVVENNCKYCKLMYVITIIGVVASNSVSFDDRHVFAKVHGI